MLGEFCINEKWFNICGTKQSFCTQPAFAFTERQILFRFVWSLCQICFAFIDPIQMCQENCLLCLLRFSATENGLQRLGEPFFLRVRKLFVELGECTVAFSGKDKPEIYAMRHIDATIGA